MIICLVVFRLCGLATRTRTQSVEHTCDVFQWQPSADGYGIVFARAGAMVPAASSPSISTRKVGADPAGGAVDGHAVYT